MISQDHEQSQQHIQRYYANVDSTYFNDVWVRLEAKQEPFGKTSLHPALHITPMASVGKVRKDNPFDKIQTLVREAVAIDMEGASFYHTTASFSGTRTLVVKSVCDYADTEKNDEYYEDASRISAIYMVSFIKEYVTSDLVPAHLPSINRQ
jgi:nucleoside phosphorylase